MRKIETTNIWGHEFAGRLKEAGILQKEIEAESGLTAATISHFVTGKDVTKKTRVKCVAAYNTILERKKQ